MNWKLIIVTLTALIICISSVTYAEIPFSDVPYGHWAYDAVTLLKKDGIIKGYSDGTFLGNRNITRYETAVMLARVYAKKAKIPYSAVNPFSDIPKNHWAKKAVVLLADAGIVTGYDDMTFLGARKINRYEMAQMVARAVKKTEQNLQFENSIGNPFADVPFGHWAYDAVIFLARLEIVEGYGDGTYLGYRGITRYEMAQMIAKAMAKTAHQNNIRRNFK